MWITITLSLNSHKKEQSTGGEELVEINLAVEGEEPRPIFLSTNLPAKLRQALLILFQESKDVSACRYAQFLDLIRN